MNKRAPEYKYVVGNVCQDPLKRTTASGKDFYVFDLAVHHGDITEFMSVSSWDNSVRRGDFIKIDGPVRVYKKKNGDLKSWMNALHIVVLKRVVEKEVNSTCSA